MRTFVYSPRSRNSRGVWVELSDAHVIDVNVLPSASGDVGRQFVHRQRAALECACCVTFPCAGELICAGVVCVVVVG